MRNALIAGATGAIGKQLLRTLNASDDYAEIHCIGRREPSISGEKITAHIVSYDALETLEDLPAIDDVFCTLGTTLKAAGSIENFKKVDRDYVHQVGKLAKRLDAKTMSVVSAVDANATSSNSYNQTKGEMEELLKSLELNSLRIFRPSLLHGPRSDFRLKEAIGFGALTVLAPLLQGRWKKYRAISTQQVAKAMFASARQNYAPVQVFESDEIQRF